jgi:hypothetical protein
MHSAVITKKKKRSGDIERMENLLNMGDQNQTHIP